MRKYKILTTWKIQNRMPDQFQIIYYNLDSSNKLQYIIKMIKLLCLTIKSDVYLSAYPNIDSIIICFLARILSRKKIKTFVYDIILQKPNNIKSYLIALCKIILFTKVDKFVCHHKDTSGYEKYYKINKIKFLYIPFKVNNYDMLSSMDIRDGNYVLACGASCRDYNTFFDSLKYLKYPAKIVLPEENVAEFHHTVFKYENIPSNIEIKQKKWFDRNEWNEYIANARIVVIPIRKGTIQCAGLSVLLESLVMGKPVVITEGEATRGIVTPDVAIIIPQGDVSAMTNAIEKIWCNDEFRILLSKNAKEFALNFKDTDRMMEDLFKAIYSEVQKR